MKLQEFKETLEKELYGTDTKENRAAGICIQCRRPAIENCYSEAGRKEFKISGLCEKCFDKICSAE